MRSHRAVGTLALVASIGVVVAVPSASANYGVSSDSAPSSSGTAAVSQDLRSPDARDAAAAASSTTQPTAVRQDLRSPDTRDVASGLSRPPAPTVEVIRLPGSSSSGFDWGDAGIGAGGVAVLLAGLAGLALTITRRGSRGISIAG